MKNSAFIWLTAITLLGSSFTWIGSVSYKIADGYAIKFTSDNPSEVFAGLKGDIQFDEANLAESRFEVTVDVATISTGNGMKN